MRPPWEELEPASRSAVERQRLAVQRLERFATTVFAASMALQVFVVLNETTETIRDAGAAPVVLQALLPAACAGMLGLLVLLSCWLLYHIQTHYLLRSSGTLLLLHIALLPSAAVVPLCITVLVKLGVTHQAMLFLTSTVLLVHVLLLLMWRHAVKGGLLFGGDVPPRVVIRQRLLLRAATLGALLAWTLSFASPAAGLAALITVLVAEVVVVALGGYTLDFGAYTSHRRRS